MVQRFKKEMGGNVKVVATGGMAQVIDQETDIFDEINTDLTLIGLRLIYELNLNTEPKK